MSLESDEKNRLDYIKPALNERAFWRAHLRGGALKLAGILKNRDSGRIYKEPQYELFSCDLMGVRHPRRLSSSCFCEARQQDS